jgi:hypothetical protein
MSTPIVTQIQPDFEFVPLSEWPQAAIDNLMADVMGADLSSLEATCPDDPDEMTDLEHALGCWLDNERLDRCGYE